VGSEWKISFVTSRMGSTLALGDFVSVYIMNINEAAPVILV
jgi:hypothetical protein